mgnify:FL=1
MVTTGVILGTALSTVVQYVKRNPNIPLLTPEHNKTIQALVALVALGAGIYAASQTPGGLLAVDWVTTLETVVTNGGIVWLAATTFYQGVLKPHAKAADQQKLFQSAEPLKPLDAGELLSGPVLDAVVKAVKNQLEPTTKP